MTPSKEPSGWLNVEKIAYESGLRMIGTDEWDSGGDSLWITPFCYEISYGDDRELEFGIAHGYRVRQDWTVKKPQQVWDEADALDGDAAVYVDALIREQRACARVFNCSASLVTAQSVTLLRHLELKPGVPTDPSRAWRDVAACLAVIDAPTFMVVDPHAVADERHKSVNKLSARAHIVALKQLGFVRMVGSRFLWGWNRDMSESFMSSYCYSTLMEAKKAGELSDILHARISDEVYGETSPYVRKALDLPDPDESMEDM